MILCALPFAGVYAQQQPEWTATVSLDVEAILSDIETNNTRLKAARQANAATMAEVRSENVPGETSVEYSPFFRSGAGGVATSEMVVSQEFDFPTMYGARRKSASLRQEVLDREYIVLRRDILLEARKLCYDLSYAIGNARLLDSRLAATDSLLAVCDMRMRHGDATIMEQNRVRMDRMTVQTETVQNNGEIERIRLALQGMGAAAASLQPSGNGATSSAQYRPASDATALTLPAEAKGADISLAAAAVKSAQQDVRTSQMGWLPKLTVGYRRNTEASEPALNGVLVGFSVPLFSNSKKVKSARLRRSATESQLDDVRNQVESRRRALQAEADNTRRLLATYDVPLMRKTLASIMYAVTAGQLSIMDYYVEADRVYSALQSRLATENAYNKAVAELSVY